MSSLGLVVISTIEFPSVKLSLASNGSGAIPSHGVTLNYTYNSSITLKSSALKSSYLVTFEFLIELPFTFILNVAFSLFIKPSC